MSGVTWQLRQYYSKPQQHRLAMNVVAIKYFVSHFDIQLSGFRLSFIPPSVHDGLYSLYFASDFQEYVTDFLSNLSHQ